MLPTTTKNNPMAGRFNGVVQSDEGPITIKNGFAIIDKELYMVSDDGTIVTNKDGNIIAVISNGRVKPITPEIVNQLRARGYVK